MAERTKFKAYLLYSVAISPHLSHLRALGLGGWMAVATGDSLS